MQPIYQKAKRLTKKVIFAEGEEERVIRAALNFRELGLGIPILVGSEEKIAENLSEIGQQLQSGIEIINSEISDKSNEYVDYLYARLQRKGFSKRDCLSLIHI